jgi:UDP-GlcNAc:undecaprenyl-phosphate GlcNAc-1-phosphate transferase
MKRKIHKEPIPRIGGVAIFLAFLGPFLGTLFYSNDFIQKIHSEPILLFVCAGAAIVFLMGLADDFFRLSPAVKFGVQIIAALFAYAGGIGISTLQLPFLPMWHLGWLSLPVTVFWYLLVTNSLNLIDGLDGLAAGVCFFASLTLLVLSLLGGRFLVAAGFAALAGSCLGFLRYNFNPASVFMGDCGSYFLGYMLASLGILGSIKGQATVAILIPVIALGLPLIDTVLSPIRRFITGQKAFQPDKSHIHHKLLKMGFSQRKAVLLIYGATIFLGVFALLLVNAQDQRGGLILLALGVCAVVGIKKLGYLEYLAADKILGYFRDVTDTTGLGKDRRSFLNLQLAMSEAANTDILWERVIDVFEHLGIDRGEMILNGSFRPKKYEWYAPLPGEALPDGATHHSSTAAHQSYATRDRSMVMAMDIPLAHEGKSYGVLHLEKNVIADPARRYVMRRIANLQLAIVRRLAAFEEETKKRLRSKEREAGSRNQYPTTEQQEVGMVAGGGHRVSR